MVENIKKVLLAEHLVLISIIREYYYLNFIEQAYLKFLTSKSNKHNRKHIGLNGKIPLMWSAPQHHPQIRAPFSNKEAFLLL